MYHIAWAGQRPMQGNISYIAREQGQYLDISQEGGFFDPHFDL